MMILFLLSSTLSSVFAHTPSGHALEIQGHRGARGNLPENTLPAFEFAVKAGADVLELDLQVTRDLQLVVSHDPVINREICVKPDGSRIPPSQELRVIDLTWNELKQYDCGRLEHPRFPRQKRVPGGAHMPSLDEVFQKITQKGAPGAQSVKFNIELKYDAAHPEWWPARDQYAKLVLERIQHWKHQNRVTLQSFDFEMVKLLRKLDPKMTLSYLSETAGENRVERALSCGAQILSPDFELLTEAEVRDAQARGLRVIPWTLNSAEQWDKAIRWRVDGIITDYPEDLVKHLKKAKPQRSASHQ